jgi:hypothetical protein
VFTGSPKVILVKGDQAIAAGTSGRMTQRRNIERRWRKPFALFLCNPLMIWLRGRQDEEKEDGLDLNAK